jgi:hypothetical protein
MKPPRELKLRLVRRGQAILADVASLERGRGGNVDDARRMRKVPQNGTFCERTARRLRRWAVAYDANVDDLAAAYLARKRCDKRYVDGDGMEDLTRVARALATASRKLEAWMVRQGLPTTGLVPWTPGETVVAAKDLERDLDELERWSR